MPRRSAADVEFSIRTATATLKPSDELDELERAEFAALVLSVPRDHFHRSDQALIEAYVRAVVGERAAAGELAACPVVDGNRPSPWLQIWNARMRAVTTLARRLGLGVASRDPTRSSPEDQTPISYYEKMNLLEGRRDDERN
jgi:hypothetical protein